MSSLKNWAQLSNVENIRPDFQQFYNLGVRSTYFYPAINVATQILSVLQFCVVIEFFFLEFLSFIRAVAFVM